MEQIILNKIVTHRNKRVFVPIFFGIFMAFYTASGAISYQNAGLLPMLEFERGIPFLSWTIWIYIILYPIYLAWAMFSFKDENKMNKTMYGFMALTVLSCICFLVFPVSYPRGSFPLSPEKSVTNIIFAMMRAVDKPSNCLPSLHVGICYLFCYGFLRENKTKFYISFFISTLVAISTLTTKQHYFYDILAGFFLAVSIFYFFDKLTSIKDS